jgi:hypothetical protein
MIFSAVKFLSQRKFRSWGREKGFEKGIYDTEMKGDPLV